jgi:hypothetical protein
MQDGQIDGTAERNYQTVIKMVQEMIVGGDASAITPALINEQIGRLLTIMPHCAQGLDREAVIEELIRRFSLWIGQDATLADTGDHEPWLTAARKRSWQYWQRYSQWLEGSLSDAAVSALDRSTDRVLELLEDPQREGTWDRRGLVVGHVQSGKTGNYTGLICKAADAGYKVIIVMAGLHNNLRAQTQIRLDEGFLGFSTRPEHADLCGLPDLVGVGRVNSDPRIRPNCATNRTEMGDFNTKAAGHLAISPDTRPWLFVVKKNKTVLQRLLGWVNKHVADTHDKESGRKIVTHLPLLLIDDEADNASVDTAEQEFDGDTPDPNHNPTAINSLIRQLLAAFSRSAYVGYTATPFANVFIHDRGFTDKEGEDIFPASFIINLAAPSNYVGPVRLFGLGRDETREGSLPLTLTIQDAFDDKGGGWMPSKHKSSWQPRFKGEDRIPDSLAEAIGSFILACAVRHLRKGGRDHSSMLIHVTRFNVVQEAVFRQVERYVHAVHQKLKRKIADRELLESLESQWKKDFIPTNRTLRQDHPDLEVGELPAWREVLASLPEVVADIKVRMINGTAKDALDYSEHDRTGLKVIAIGGDKLARGLTLEGLCTSYFLRASQMYDTLMQMGRWFGYRPGYLDVCRLYTTSDLIEWFCHITDAAEELREEFDLMAESGGTPRDYGLKVQSHPTLMVTSRAKMHAAKKLLLSFSGTLVETVALYRDGEVLRRNLDAANRLVMAMGVPQEGGTISRIRAGKSRNWEGYLWDKVPAAEIVSFLGSYKTHTAAYRVDGALLSRFIDEMNLAGELTSWTVALIGGGEGREISLGSGLTVKTLERRGDENRDHYSIGRLLSPRDESIDLDDAYWEAALEETRKAWHADPGRRKAKTEPEEPNGPAVRKVRGLGTATLPPCPERGVLLLYALDPEKSGLGLSGDTPDVIAFGMSFPGSRAGKKVEYVVGNVMWNQWGEQYGTAD